MKKSLLSLLLIGSVSMLPAQDVPVIEVDPVGPEIVEETEGVPEIVECEIDPDMEITAEEIDGVAEELDPEVLDLDVETEDGELELEAETEICAEDGELELEEGAEICPEDGELDEGDVTVTDFSGNGTYHIDPRSFQSGTPVDVAPNQRGENAVGAEALSLDADSVKVLEMERASSKAKGFTVRDRTRGGSSTAVREGSKVFLRN